MTNPRDADHVRQALHTLNRECMAASLEALGAQAAQAAWSYATWLAPWLRDELTARDERRLSVATPMARLPLHKTLEPFEVAFQPRVEKRRIQELASVRCGADGSNVLVLGPPGVGQTHLAIGLGITALQAGLSTYVVSVPERIDLSSPEAPRGQWLKRMQQLGKPTLLSWDERGDLPVERPRATLLLQLVAKRSAQGAMMLSRHKSFRAWGELCTDQVLATARLDRLLHHSTIINIRGQRDRLKDKRHAGVFPRPERLEAATALS